MTTMATVEVRLSPVSLQVVEPVAEALMDALEAHPSVVGPMVVADAARGDVVVSFEFAASGDETRDRPRAQRIIDTVISGPHGLDSSLSAAPTFTLAG